MPSAETDGPLSEREDGCIIVISMISADLGKIQRLQNRCLRLCLGYNRFHSTDKAHKTAQN